MVQTLTGHMDQHDAEVSYYGIWTRCLAFQSEFIDRTNKLPPFRKIDNSSLLLLWVDLADHLTVIFTIRPSLFFLAHLIDRFIVFPNVGSVIFQIKLFIQVNLVPFIWIVHVCYSLRMPTVVCRNQSPVRLLSAELCTLPHIFSR